jgi:hypothetical protein
MPNCDTKTKSDYLLEKGCKLDHKIKSSYFQDKTAVSGRHGTLSTYKNYYSTAPQKLKIANFSFTCR